MKKFSALLLTIPLGLTLLLGLDQMPECEWGKLCHSHVCKCEGEFHRSLPPDSPDNPNNPRFPRQVCNNSCKKRECCRCSERKGSASAAAHSHDAASKCGSCSH